MPEVAIIMGSKNDYDYIKPAEEILIKFGVSYEKRVVSAHRTPEFMMEFAKEARGRGVKVIIAAAGGAAHLPGMTASFTTLPVIGVPIPSKNLKGLDSLLSIVQMPFGVPVATVAIDGARNAALLAIRILGLINDQLNKKLEEFREEMKNEVLNTSL